MIKTTKFGSDGNNMKKHKILTRVATLGISLLLAALAGCAAAPPTTGEVIAERAQARWDSLLAKDYATAYSYYSPGFRSRVSIADLEIKVRLQRVRWTGAKYRDHSCTGDVCTVRIDLTYQVGAPVPGVNTWAGFDLIEEQWLKTGGEWWYIPPKD
jgi:hypothetical protein